MTNGLRIRHNHSLMELRLLLKSGITSKPIRKFCLGYLFSLIALITNLVLLIWFKAGFVTILTTLGVLTLIRCVDVKGKRILKRVYGPAFSVYHKYIATDRKGLLLESNRNGNVIQECVAWDQVSQVQVNTSTGLVCISGIGSVTSNGAWIVNSESIKICFALTFEDSGNLLKEIYTRTGTSSQQ